MKDKVVLIASGCIQTAFFPCPVLDKVSSSTLSVNSGCNLAKLRIHQVFSDGRK